METIEKILGKLPIKKTILQKMSGKIKQFWKPITLILLVGILYAFYSYTAKIIRQQGINFQMPTTSVERENRLRARQKAKAQRGKTDQYEANILTQNNQKNVQPTGFSQHYNFEKNEPMVESQKVDSLPKIVAKRESQPSKLLTKPKYEREKKIINPLRENAEKPIQTEENSFNTTILVSNPVSEKSSKKTKTEFMKAAFYGNQLVRSGANVRLRFLENVSFEGEEIPINAIGNGVVMLNNNRAMIVLTSIKLSDRNLPVKMILYDQDLLPGIAFQGANSVQENLRNQQNQGIDNTTESVLSNLPLSGIAGVGVDIAKGVSRSFRYGGIQKKMGEIELLEGYKVFMKVN